MIPRIRHRLRGPIAVVATALLAMAAAAPAAEYTSPSFQLQDPVLGAGGDRAAAADASMQLMPAVLGEPAQALILNGPSSGTTLEVGFVVSVPEPGTAATQWAALTAVAGLGVWRRRSSRRATRAGC